MHGSICRWVLGVLAFCCVCSSARASELDVLLNMMVEKGIITSVDAQEIRNEIGGQAKQRDDQQKAQITEVAATLIPKWTQQLAWSGDTRLRHESIYRHLAADRNRERIRLRTGFKAAVTPVLESGVRIATGTNLDPVSTNQTLADIYDKKDIFLDQAYLRYTTAGTPLGKRLPFTVWGGKFDNPFYSSSLVWDPDLTLEGLAGSVTPTVGRFQFALTGGAFPVDEIKRVAADPALFAGQAGATWSVAPQNWRSSLKALKVKGAVGYFGFSNLDSGLKTTGGSRFGNTSLSSSTSDVTFLKSGFGELTVSGEVSSLILARPVKLQGDYVQNTKPSRKNQGYQVGLRWGKSDVPWSVEIGGFWQRLEADAVVGQFTDSDFGEGGTGRDGYAVFATLGTFKNSTLGAKWFGTDSLSQRDRIRRLQIDWVTKL